MSERWEGGALVLSSVDSGSDRVLRFLTDDDRVVAAVARHARRASRRPRASVQALSLVELSFDERPGDELARLTQATTEHAFPVVKGALPRFGLATTMAEVVLTLVHEFGREEGIFGLLSRAWRVLDDPQREPVEELLLLFELRALSLGGILPPIEALSELSGGARQVLAGWLQGRWRRLEEGDRRQVSRALEGLIAEASGSRGLKSRAFLDSVLTS